MRNYSADQFELLEELGKGSFGIVHKALDKVTNRIVAIKQIDLESSDEDINEIQKEIAILSTCKFPQIIKYYGCFVNKYQLLIIMEILQGGSCLDLLISIKYFKEHQIAIICREILKALSYLHSNNKIHRDIKAANILIDDHNGDVKVVDFGVATQLSNNLSKRNTFVGTPFWMSPEVILQHDYNCKTDIWSLGITALELALGKPPYSNLHPLKVLFLIPKNPSPGLPSISPFSKKSYSREFQSFIKLCLQKNPNLRPTAKQLLSHPFISHARRNIELLECVDSKRQNDLRKILTKKDEQKFESNHSKKSQIDPSRPKPIKTKCRESLGNTKSRLISFDFDNLGVPETCQKNADGCVKQKNKILSNYNLKVNHHEQPISPHKKVGQFFSYNSDDETDDSHNRDLIEQNKENQIQSLENPKKLLDLKQKNILDSISEGSFKDRHSIKSSNKSQRNSSGKTSSKLKNNSSSSGSSSKHAVLATNLVLLDTTAPNLSPTNNRNCKREYSPLSISPVKLDSPSPSSLFTPLSSTSSNETSLHESGLNTNLLSKAFNYSPLRSNASSMRKSGGSSLRRSQTTNNLGESSNTTQSSVMFSPTSKPTLEHKFTSGSNLSSKSSQKCGNSETNPSDPTEIFKGQQRGSSNIAHISQIKQYVSDTSNILNIANSKSAHNLDDFKRTNSEYLRKSVFEFELRESKLQKYKKNQNNLFSENGRSKYSKANPKKNECSFNKRDSIEELLLSRWAESMVERWSEPTRFVEDNC